MPLPFYHMKSHLATETRLVMNRSAQIWMTDRTSRALGQRRRKSPPLVACAGTWWITPISMTWQLSINAAGFLFSHCCLRGSTASWRIATFATVVAAGLMPHAGLFGAGRATPVETTPPSSMPIPTERQAKLSNSEMLALIHRLDSARFDLRNRATRDLVAQGDAAIPFLVDALGQSSRELQFRVGELLKRYYAFDDVAPFLIRAMEQPHGRLARSILRNRVVQYVDQACGMEHADQLFKFWGIKVQTFRLDVIDAFNHSRSCADAARAVQPLLNLGEKTVRFRETVERLKGLSMPYQHQYSSGHVIATTMASGLRHNRSDLISFAQSYLSAFEKLARDIERASSSRHAVRKEVSERAEYCHGAARYLIAIMAPESPERKVLIQRVGVRPEQLRDVFCQGLASPDRKACYQNVGKVHIADMLTELLIGWDNVPTDGIVDQLVQRVALTVYNGDKPKALGLLDALQACKELPQHQLDLQQGLGKQLAKSLATAASQSTNYRSYYPVRAMHNQMLALADMGILSDNEAFPNSLVQRCLEKPPDSISPERMLALERYVRILKRLRKANPALDQPAVRRLLLTMRDNLTSHPELLIAGLKQAEQRFGPIQNGHTKQ